MAARSLCPGGSRVAAMTPRSRRPDGQTQGRLVLLRGGFGGLRLGTGALGNTGGLAAAAAQVIQLGAADVAAADHRDLSDRRGIQWEDALHALAVADLAHGE